MDSLRLVLGFHGSILRRRDQANYVDRSGNEGYPSEQPKPALEVLTLVSALPSRVELGPTSY